ncbi:MAG TPA: hypothetical protein VF677_07335 [Flavobacterium sp.]|jgi:hypothetical protein
MDIIISQIEETEFNKLNIPILFSDAKTNRCYGIISNHNYSYRFSWQSDVVKPNITEVKNGIYAIGIDQNLSIIDFNINSITCSLELTYFFYDTKIFDNFIYIITELEIIKIDIIAFKIIKEYELPDVFKEMVFANNKVRVQCLDDNIIYLS